MQVLLEIERGQRGGARERERERKKERERGGGGDPQVFLENKRGQQYRRIFCRPAADAYAYAAPPDARYVELGVPARGLKISLRLGGSDAGRAGDKVAARPAAWSSSLANNVNRKEIGETEVEA